MQRTSDIIMLTRQIYKIRQVAAALLDCPAEPAASFAPLHRRVRTHVKSFTEVLVKIDADAAIT
jgi:hypothetical protein